MTKREGRQVAIISGLAARRDWDGITATGEMFFTILQIGKCTRLKNPSSQKPKVYKLKRPRTVLYSSVPKLPSSNPKGKKYRSRLDLFYFFGQMLRLVIGEVMVK